MTYQLLPEMSAEQYKALKDDIQARGVMIPLEYDSEGNLLDGHHRLKACVELGITDYPTTIRHFATEEEKRYHVRAINAVRRQLTQEQMRQIIAEQLKDAPQKSNRQIATELGISHVTVGTQREKLESRGQIDHVEKVVDTLGREQPRQKDKMVENNQLCESHSSIGADGKERPRQVERKPVDPEPIESSPMVDDEEIDETQYSMFDEEDTAEATQPKILSFNERESDTEPTQYTPKIIDMASRHQSDEQSYYRKLDLGHDTYKRLARIYDVIDNFETTDERIEALSEYFDENMPLDEQIEFLNDATEKLQKIKTALLRSKKYEKRRN